MSFIIDETSGVRTLVVSGRWTSDAEEMVSAGEVDRLELNYARGFKERDLAFLDSWPIRELMMIARDIDDLASLERLGGSLESLSIDAAPESTLNLDAFPHLRSLAVDWSYVEGDLLHTAAPISDLTIRAYNREDLWAVALPSLTRLRLIGAQRLRSANGINESDRLRSLSIYRAQFFEEPEQIGTISRLDRVEFELCTSLVNLDWLRGQTELRFLGVSDCGLLESLRPLVGMTKLEKFYAWGNTRIEDGDLSVLMGLPSLRDVRMRDRREYVPRVADIQGHIARHDA